MKFKKYLTSYIENIDIGHIDKTSLNKRFTSEEISKVSFECNPEIPKYNETMYSSLSTQYNKKCVLEYIMNRIQQNKYRSIISLGGTCVVEHILAYGTKPDVKIYATDFNNYSISNAKRFFFQNITTDSFDFYSDSLHKLCDKYDTKFDLAFFQHSVYVLDDDEFIKLLMDLKENDIKEIIDIREKNTDI